MKPANTHIAPSIRKVRAIILLGTLAVVITTVACSTQSRSAATLSMPGGGPLRPAALQTSVPAVSQAADVAAAPAVTGKNTSSLPKASGLNLLVYRSRDYGVSFRYPWQYAFLSAKVVANGDASLRPKSDGHDGQFTLARIEIPKGFYSDTDYETGYFTLSLNQDLNEEECQSVLNPGKDGKVETESINGVEFRWMETDTGGRGQASRLRQYVTFTNGTCYELELGVKTRNDGGLAREVDPDQVLRRLNTMLKTVKILPSAKPVATVVESSTAVSTAVPQQ